MKHCLLVNVLPDFFEEAWNYFEEKEITILYGSQEEGLAELVIELEEKAAYPQKKWIESISPFTLPPIDWENQWARHGSDYRDGMVHVDLTTFSKNTPFLLLKPGPGFGDFSHPTTRLSLKLLAEHLDEQEVIDIGSGSGILSISAALMGSPLVYGIDIDKEALCHSTENALLNKVNERCLFFEPEKSLIEPSLKPRIILMNMIQSEQEVAKPSLSFLSRQPGIYITSGIRSSDKKRYLEKTNEWGWSLLHEETEEGWSAFVFQFSGTA